MYQEDLAAAVSNVITLVDIARKDVLELDTLIKVGINSQPSVLVDIDRLKSCVTSLEEKVSLLDKYYGIKVTDATSDRQSTSVAINKRIDKLEKILYISTGVLLTIAAILSYGSKLVKLIG